MIKIFVGTAGNNEDLESQVVLHWSLKKNASRPFVICFMNLSKNPRSDFYSDGRNGWQISHWTTPFSGFRWAVPELCAFKGEAIYMDSDVIVRGDIAELWDEELRPGKIVLARGPEFPGRLCVCKWNCTAAKSWLPKITDIQANPACHRYLMKKIAADVGLVQSFGNAGNWNLLDIEAEDPAAKALHYTGIPTHLGLKYSVPRLEKTGQKHWFAGVPRTHPNKKLREEFDFLLFEALEAGFRIEDYRVDSLFGNYGLARYGN